MEFLEPDAIIRSLEYQAPITDTEAFVLVEIAKKPMESPTYYGNLRRLGPDMMSRIVRKLVGLGFVYERKNPSNRRFTQLGMTPAGLAALQEMVDHRMARSMPLRNLWTWTGEGDPVRVGPDPKT
jgi:DNA-binding MarR family transcriptional regulator